ARCASLRAVRSRPSTVIVPLSGTSIAPTRWSRVDLPEPDRPVTATVWPAGMSSVTSSSARTGMPDPVRYVLRTAATCRSLIAGSPCCRRVSLRRGRGLDHKRLFGGGYDIQVGAGVKFGRGDEERVHCRRADAAGFGEGVQLADQVRTLTAEHSRQHRGIAGAHGSHHLEEEVVAVAARADTRLGEPAAQFVAAGRGDPVHDPVWFDLLRTPFGFDQPVAGEPVEQLVKMPDVQSAPLVADGLFELALQLVTVGGFAGEQRQDRVVQRHLLGPYIVTR